MALDVLLKPEGQFLDRQIVIISEHQLFLARADYCIYFTLNHVNLQAVVWFYYTTFIYNFKFHYNIKRFSIWYKFYSTVLRKSKRI